MRRLPIGLKVGNLGGWVLRLWEGIREKRQTSIEIDVLGIGVAGWN